MVSPDDLVDNALLFGQEAVEHYLVREDGEGYDWRFVSLFAATSLEQLLKAFLVATNPLLIANNRDSLLALAGAKVRIKRRSEPLALPRRSTAPVLSFLA